MTAWKRSWLRSLRKYWPMYLMLVPVIAYFLVFKYKPMLFVQIAFKDYKLRKGIWASEWVGLKHFMRFFSSYNFKTTLVNTAVLSGLSLLCCFPFPIFLALLFNELRTDRTKKLVRTITYAPHFISTIVMVGMMIAICSPSTGIVNKILIALGITEDGLYLMGSGKYFRMMYILSDIWKNSGWNAIIFISAISAIEPTLYEAARVDGASRWQQLIYVTLPSILPTIVIMLILRCGAIMNVNFEKVLLLYSPSTYATADVISTYVYRAGIIKQKIGYSTAVGLFNSVVSLMLVLGANYLSNKFTDSGLF